MAAENPEDFAKQKAAELIDDPKFKRGTVLNSLSTNSQEILKEIRKIRARDVSNSWHSKWVSKGNPRELGASGSTDEPLEDGDPLPRDEVVPEGGAAAHGAADPVPDDEASKRLNLNSERVPWSDIDFD